MLLDDIIFKGMACIAHTGWSQFNLLEFCYKEKIDFYDVTFLMPTKESFLTVAMTWVDHKAAAMAAKNEDATLSESEQLFEAIMERFDILMPFRPALKSIKETTLENPFDGLNMGYQWIEHLYKTLDKSVPVLSKAVWISVYIRAFYTWLDDDDTCSNTMKILDQTIQQVFDFNQFTFKHKG